MFNIKFLLYVAMIIFGSMSLGMQFTLDNNCTKDQNIFQCIIKESK